MAKRKEAKKVKDDSIDETSDSEMNVMREEEHDDLDSIDDKDSNENANLAVLRDSIATLKVQFGTERVYEELADTGADHSAIDRRFIKELKAAGTFVPISTLETPLTLQLAIETNAEGKITKRKQFIVKDVAQSTPVILLPQGPLSLRNVAWMIAESHLNVMLLARPELDFMGFNASDHLAAVRENFHEKNFANANPRLMAAMENSDCERGKIATNLSLLSANACVPIKLGGDFTNVEYDDSKGIMIHDGKIEALSPCGLIDEPESGDNHSDGNTMANISVEAEGKYGALMRADVQKSPQALFYGYIPSDDPFEVTGADVNIISIF